MSASRSKKTGLIVALILLGSAHWFSWKYQWSGKIQLPVQKSYVATAIGPLTSAPPPVSVYMIEKDVIRRTVKRGETLKKIAQDMNIPMKELATVNGIYDPYRVYTGQEIRWWRKPN